MFLGNEARVVDKPHVAREREVRALHLRPVCMNWCISHTRRIWERRDVSLVRAVDKRTAHAHRRTPHMWEIRPYIDRRGFIACTYTDISPIGAAASPIYTDIRTMGYPNRRGVVRMCVTFLKYGRHIHTYGRCIVCCCCTYLKRYAPGQQVRPTRIAHAL